MLATGSSTLGTLSTNCNSAAIPGHLVHGIRTALLPGVVSFMRGVLAQSEPEAELGYVSCRRNL